MGTIIAVANHKGGTSKTTTVHTLGVHFADGGYRVLMVDLDGQATLTASCRVEPAEGRTLADVLGAAQPGTLSLADVVVSLAPGFDLVPASVELSASELGMAARKEAFLLKQVLEPVREDYDVILLDCAPGRGVLMVNALAAADGVICPTKLSSQDLGGLKLFIEGTLVRIVKNVNPGLKMVGIVPTFYHGRTVYHQANLAALQKRGLPVLQPISQSIRVEEAPAVGETILTYEPDNPVAVAYRELGRQVEQWVSAHVKPPTAP